MMTSYSILISERLHIPEKQVKSTLSLLESGATIPFISRYRKEVTGGLDEVQIGNVQEALERFQALAERKSLYAQQSTH